MSSTNKEALRALIAKRAVIEGPFTLSNGSVSAYYFDCKRVTLNSEGASRVGEAVADIIDTLSYPNVAIGGLTLGADAIVIAAMICAHQRGRALEGFYVRKDAKKHGTKNYIENAPAHGTPVVIVDDVVTTGRSIIDAIDHAETEGCKVVAVIAVVDRLEGGTQKIKDRVPHARYQALFTLSDFPEIEEIKAKWENSEQLSHAASM